MINNGFVVILHTLLSNQSTNKILFTASYLGLFFLFIYLRDSRGHLFVLFSLSLPVHDCYRKKKIVCSWGMTFIYFFNKPKTTFDSNIRRKHTLAISIWNHTGFVSIIIYSSIVRVLWILTSFIWGVIIKNPYNRSCGSEWYTVKNT